MLLHGLAIAFLGRFTTTSGLHLTPINIQSSTSILHQPTRRCFVVAKAKRRRPREDPSSSEWFEDERPQRNDDDYFDEADWFKEERPPRRRKLAQAPLWERASGRVRRAAVAFLQDDFTTVRGRDRRDDDADTYGERTRQRRTSRKKSGASSSEFFRELGEVKAEDYDIDAEFGGRRFVERWAKWGPCDVLRPPDEDTTGGRLPLAPVGVVHLVGGAVVGVSPKLSYEGLCTKLADRGFLVVATPLRLGPGGLFDHRGLAATCAKDFAAAWPFVEERYGAAAAKTLRIFGFGHSLGAKLHLLIGADPKLLELASPVPRAANVLVAYNNFKAEQSVPLLKEFRLLQAELAESDGALESAGGFVSDTEAAIAAEAAAAARQRLAAASLRRQKTKKNDIDDRRARMTRKPTAPSSSGSSRNHLPTSETRIAANESAASGTHTSQSNSEVGILEEAAVLAAAATAEEVELRTVAELVAKSAVKKGLAEEARVTEGGMKENNSEQVYTEDDDKDDKDWLEEDAYDGEDLHDDEDNRDDDDERSDEVYTRWFEDGSNTYKRARFGPRQAAKLWQSTGWPLLRSASQVVGSAASGAARGASKAAKQSDVKLLRAGARLADDVVHEVGSAIDGVLDDDDDEYDYDDEYESGPSKNTGGAQSQSQQQQQRQRRRRERERQRRRSRESRISSPEAFLRTATKAATKAAATVRGALATEFDPPPSEIEALVSNQYAIPCNLVVQFSSDALDQSPRLATLLKRKFGAFGVSASSSSSSSPSSSSASEATTTSTMASDRAEPASRHEGSDLRAGNQGAPAGGGAAAAAAGLVRGAERSFARLPGNHGTPNDYNPGDTWPGSEEWGSSSGSGSSDGSKEAGRDRGNKKPPADAIDVTLELGLLADCAADYMTDRALWRRPS